jgi:hypothetical protein
MVKMSKQKVSQAIAFLTCTGVLWMHLDDFGASEFSGGRLTGKLFTMADLGALLLLLALLLTMFFPRTASRKWPSEYPQRDSPRRQLVAELDGRGSVRLSALPLCHC